VCPSHVPCLLSLLLSPAPAAAPAGDGADEADAPEGPRGPGGGAGGRPSVLPETGTARPRSTRVPRGREGDRLFLPPPEASAPRGTTVPSLNADWQDRPQVRLPPVSTSQGSCPTSRGSGQPVWGPLTVSVPCSCGSWSCVWSRSTRRSGQRCTRSRTWRAWWPRCVNR
jgi:hypothetical protein